MKTFSPLILCFFPLILTINGLSLKRKLHFPNILKMHSFTENNSDFSSFAATPKISDSDNFENPPIDTNHEENPTITLRKKDIEGFKKSMQFLVSTFAKL